MQLTLPCACKTLGDLVKTADADSVSLDGSPRSAFLRSLQLAWRMPVGTTL